MAEVPPKMPRSSGDTSGVSSSDDNALIMEIQATHSPDGREFALKPLLEIVDDGFHRAIPEELSDIVRHMEAHQSRLDDLDDKAVEKGLEDMLDLLCCTINKVSCEISSKRTGVKDAHETAFLFLDILSSYSWDAKVVLALAAFAVNYGEFWLAARVYLTKPPVAQDAPLVKQLLDIFKRSDPLKPRFDAVNNLISGMIHVAKCIFEVEELPSQYITPDNPEMRQALAHIPTAVYWTMRGIVACGPQIIGLIGKEPKHGESSTEASELSSLAEKLSNSHLKELLDLCYQHIEEKKHIEAYQTLVRLFESAHIDNTRILRALTYNKEDQLPLFDGSTKRRVSIDVLRRKDVLLFISDLDLSQEELSILEQIYAEARQHPARAESRYEVVWLPVVERLTPWNEAKKEQFETLQSMMPWYTVYHPSMLDPAVIRYIKEVWHFNKKPLLVVLDPQGRVVNTNAIRMMWIWGSLAFPFTRLREELLWREETWRIELLVDGIDPNILSWIAQGKYICLYGGEDIEWIRKFNMSAEAVARAARIQLETIYVGKSNPGENVKRINSILQLERISHVWPDLAMIWFFWERLESMWHSKVQLNRTVENDSIMQEIRTMLSFDGSEQGWALISKGSAEMAKAKGDTMLKCFVDYEVWSQQAIERGFVPALIDYLHQLGSPLDYEPLILPRPGEGIHIDNIMTLRVLIYNKDDQLPLYDGSTKKRASLDVLRRRNVLLFISDLDLSHEELAVLEQIYREARLHPERGESQYEVVWLPIVERSTPLNEAREQQFETLQSTMPWYTVYHPFMLDPAVIRHIKEVWHFNKKPLLVVLDPQGRVVNPNAFHMMWIWGNEAYPFSSQREEALWEEETWRIELLANGIDPLILTWIAQGTHICLYGGEDIEWIRKFTLIAHAVAQAASIQLEMIYVGKSNPGEKVRRNNVIIEAEKLSHVWPDLVMIWFFWERLESMWHSKVQLNRTVENDSIMQEILTMLSFDGSEQGWAVISKGSAEMAKAKGDTMVKCFLNYEVWSQQVEERGFVPALIDRLNQLHSPLHCKLHNLPRPREGIHIDNIMSLRALIYNKDDQLPLYDGSTHKRASLDVLRRKSVLLFISDLDLSHEELSSLEIFYAETRLYPGRPESQYEVVWLPVVERSTPWDEARKQQFETLQSMMPWYTVYHPSMLDPAVIRYIKEVWHFNKKPLLVALDPQGRVVNPNAIHMIWIWGSLAYPFTSQREEALWKEETWRIELLVDGIDPNILPWIAQGTYICLYGGERIEWIRKFTTIAHAVAQAANIQLDMIYVGKSNLGKKVRKNNVRIEAEKLSHVWPDLDMIWFFWERLESMWHSKVQLNRTVENDSIMQEIETMLSFGRSEQGWAVISRGSAEMAKAKGDTILDCFLDFEAWRQRATEQGFVPTLIDCLNEIRN